jgi:hypothetical protein
MTANMRAAVGSNFVTNRLITKFLSIIVPVDFRAPNNAVQPLLDHLTLALRPVSTVTSDIIAPPQAVHKTGYGV